MEDAGVSRGQLNEPPGASRSTLLFESQYLSIHAVTLGGGPEVVQRVGAGRANAYSGQGPWNYGLDDYDWYAVQIVATEPGKDEPVGGLRVGFGDLILREVGLPGLYLSHFYDFTPEASEAFCKIAEYGRVWVDPQHPRSLGVLYGLLQALCNLVDRAGDYLGVCGTISLLDYPTASRELVAGYLRANHPWRSPLIQPLYPISAYTPDPTAEVDESPPRSRKLHEVSRALKSVDKDRRLPPSLHIYLRHGARLLGDVGLDQSGRKLVVPLYMSLGELQIETQRMAALAG